MLALSLGGSVAEAAGWRMTFVIFGLPGLLLALIFAITVDPPKRGEADGIAKVQESSFLAALWRLLRIRTYLLMLLGATTHSVLGYGALQWMPSFYIRRFDLSTAEVGLAMGPVWGVSGIVGIFATAFLADRMASRDLRWYAWILAAGVILSFPLFLVALTFNAVAISLVAFGLCLFFGKTSVGITSALIQNTAPVQMRGMAAGLKTVCLSLIGYGLGGALISALNDLFGAVRPAVWRSRWESRLARLLYQPARTS